MNFLDRLLAKIEMLECHDRHLHMLFSGVEVTEQAFVQIGPLVHGGNK